MMCERFRASGTIRHTLKTVHFTTPFSSAWPLDILHFGKLDDAVQCFSICAHLSPARDSACEQSYGWSKLEGDAPKNACHPGFVENRHLTKISEIFCWGREIKDQRATYAIAAHVIQQKQLRWSYACTVNVATCGMSYVQNLRQQLRESYVYHIMRDMYSSSSISCDGAAHELSTLL